MRNTQAQLQTSVSWLDLTTRGSFLQYVGILEGKVGGYNVPRNPHSIF